MATEKKRLTHPFSKVGPSQKCFARLKTLFTSSLPLPLYSLLTLVPHSFSLLFYKRIWHPGRPWQDSYFETFICHLLSQLAFQIKLNSLPQHLSLMDSLTCCAASSELGLSNTVIILRSIHVTAKSIISFWLSSRSWDVCVCLLEKLGGFLF